LSSEKEKYEALEEAFDRDLEGVSNKLGNGNGKGSKKDQKQAPKHDYMTFKYSSRFRSTLHEAILLNGIPVFLKYENGQIQAVPVIEEQDRILRPPSIEEYPYEPIEFNSFEELKKYQDTVLNEVDKEISPENTGDGFIIRRPGRRNKGPNLSRYPLDLFTRLIPYNTLLRYFRNR
jgi:hypothetical protein